MEWQILFVDRVIDLLTDGMVDLFVFEIQVVQYSKTSCAVSASLQSSR